jgi:hypothetical protein
VGASSCFCLLRMEATAPTMAAKKRSFRTFIPALYAGPGN